LLCTLVLSGNGDGKCLIRKDTLFVMAAVRLADTGVSPVKFRFAQDMEYSFFYSNQLFVNWHQGDRTSMISLFHQFKYRSKFSDDRNIRISNSFFHELGIQYFFDSIFRFQPDENTLDTRLEVRIAKKITFSVFSNLATRTFNSFRYSHDSNGVVVKTLSGSFLTPLLWTFSTGFTGAISRIGTISMGLSAARFTWVRNRGVYNQPYVISFYGVPRWKSCTFEYGLSMHLQTDVSFLTGSHWNCDLLVFKNYDKPVDLAMKTFVGIKLNKFLKATIQTRLLYEKEVSKQVQVEILVSLGFYFPL